MKLRGVVVAIFVLFALRLQAAPDSLTEIERHYQRLEYDQALSLLAAQRKSEHAPEPLARGWLYEGYIDIALGRDAAAREAFAEALALAPAIRPAPDTSPRLTSVFNAVLSANAEKLARRAAARVQLEPIPPPLVAARAIEVHAHAQGAMTPKLSVRDAARELQASLPMTPHGDEYVGQIPGEFCQPNAHLELEVALYDGADRLAHTAQTATITLPAFVAALELYSPVRGAEVYVDDARVGTTPLAGLIPIEPGKHRVRMTAKRAQVSEELEAKAGEIARATLLPIESGSKKETVVRYSLLATGGVLLIAGAVLAAESASAASALERASRSSQGLPTTEFADVASDQSNGRAFNAGAITCFVVGGVVAATGALLLLLPRHKAK